MTTALQFAPTFMGRIPNRVECNLPIDTDGSDERFLNAGFTFGDTTENPLYRAAVLPVRWRLVGDRILDEYGRVRVCIYAWTSINTTYAHMHLTDLRVHLRQCVANGENPLIDPVWATQAAVLGAAYREIRRCDERIDHYSLRGTPRDVEAEAGRRVAFVALTQSLSLDMAGVA